MISCWRRFERAGLESKKGATIHFSAFGYSTLHEYREKRAFCMLFAWLYLGGNGDFNESQTVDSGVKYGARQHMCVAVGRFAGDKTWCFYALNYDDHRRTMT
jgi:hypothetical protein